MFKAVPTIELLKALNMYSPMAPPPTSVKKLGWKPLRTCELNLDEFIDSPKMKTKNVRKQLWSVSKGDNKDDRCRRITTMKPIKESLRKSVYSRPSLMQPRKNSTKQLKGLSIVDTLPLVKIDQLTETKIKRTLFSSTLSKQPNQRKSTSYVNKQQILSNIPKKVSTPIPAITITSIEPETKNKIKEDKLELIFDKLLNIEEKLNTLTDVKTMLSSICVHLGIDKSVNVSTNDKEQTQKYKEIEPISTTAKLSTCFKNKVSTIKEKINNTELEEKNNKLSPFVINRENRTEFCSSNVTNTPEVLIKFSPCTSTITSAQSEKLELFKLNLSPCDKKMENGKNENCEKPINTNNDDDDGVSSLKDSPCTSNNQISKSLKFDDIFTPKIGKNTINAKTESTIKLKKIWSTEFELIENKLLNNLNESINLKSSPDVSPVKPLQLEIDKMVNDDDSNQLTLKKSQSTSNLLETNTSPGKNILFKSRSRGNVVDESISVYNKLRNELPKFLSTPVTKENKTMTLMTPSVQGNAKKTISRRVQEQLLRLNDS